MKGFEEEEKIFKYIIDGQEKSGSCRVINFDLGGGISLEMVRIPKGKFTMGSPKSEYELSHKDGRGFLRRLIISLLSPRSEKERDDDETQHEETIEKDFFLGRYVITQEQYQAIMGTPDGIGTSHFEGKRLPVDQVTWHEAHEFCEKLSNRFGMKFELPHEKEWEYACRAGTTTPFHFGSVLNGNLANCDGNYPYGTENKGKFLEKTTEVGSYPPNPWGLYDMHGNVFEWCENLYNIEENDRVLRGGSWRSDAGYCRSASRIRGRSGNRFYSLIGFRVCLRLD